MAKNNTKETAAKQDAQKAAGGETKEKAIPSNVDRLMRLYPQYEEIYVTPQGFVHPKDAPKYALKGAVLYKNKYYKS